MSDRMQASNTESEKPLSIRSSLELTHDTELVAPISNLTYSALLKDAYLYPAAKNIAKEGAAAIKMRDQTKTSDTPSLSLSEEILETHGARNIRGSGEPYPYPNQTGWDSPQGSGDYNPYKYQDGNIYH